MGAVFAMFAGFYHYQYPETLGQIHFWITFLSAKDVLPVQRRRSPERC